MTWLNPVSAVMFDGHPDANGKTAKAPAMPNLESPKRRQAGRSFWHVRYQRSFKEQ
jgi:hypothetical protein